MREDHIRMNMLQNRHTRDMTGMGLDNNKVQGEVDTRNKIIAIKLNIL